MISVRAAVEPPSRPHCQVSQGGARGTRTAWSPSKKRLVSENMVATLLSGPWFLLL